MPYQYTFDPIEFTIPRSQKRISCIVTISMVGLTVIAMLAEKWMPFSKEQDRAG
jgi:hypothetical protein